MHDQEIDHSFKVMRKKNFSITKFLYSTIPPKYKQLHIKIIQPVHQADTLPDNPNIFYTIHRQTVVIDTNKRENFVPSMVRN